MSVTAVTAVQLGALPQQNPPWAAGTGPRVRGSSASSFPFQDQKPCSAQGSPHLPHYCNSQFIFKLKNNYSFFLIELPAKLSGEPQNCCVGTFRLQQEVFVVAAGPVHHFQHAGQSPLRFVPGSQALAATTQIREDASMGGQKES